MDSRAVSAVLGYVLTLGVMALLISGLFFAAGNYVETQQERVIRAELQVVGNRLAADIAAVDRLALVKESAGEAELTSFLPRSTAGQHYQIEISPVAGTSGVYHLNLTTSDPDVSIEIRVRAQTPLASSTVSGGNVIVSYDGNDIEVRDA